MAEPVDGGSLWLVPDDRTISGLYLWSARVLVVVVFGLWVAYLLSWEGSNLNFVAVPVVLTPVVYYSLVRLLSESGGDDSTATEPGESRGPRDLGYFKLASKWDYLALVPLTQLLIAALGFALIAVDRVVAAHLMAGYALVGIALLTNPLSWLAAPAAWFGSKYHDHVDIPWWYAALAVPFGTLLGPYYLWMTGRE